MKNVKTKSFRSVKALMVILVGVLIFSCENEGIVEDERTIPHEIPSITNEIQLRCTASDPAVAAIHIDYSTFPIHVLYPGDPSPRFNFTIDFTNFGATPWNTEGASFQCYRSKDAVLGNADDLPAGGKNLSTTATPPTLEFLEIHTEGWYNTIFIPDFADYPYLIVKLNLPARASDCYNSNNYLVEYINFPIVEDKIYPLQ